LQINFGAHVPRAVAPAGFDPPLAAQKDLAAAGFSLLVISAFPSSSLDARFDE